jgi:hypothetical protein
MQENLRWENGGKEEGERRKENGGRSWELGVGSF